MGEGLFVPLSIISQACNGDVAALISLATERGFPIHAGTTHQPSVVTKNGSDTITHTEVPPTPDSRAARKLHDIWVELFAKGRKSRITDKKRKIINTRLKSFGMNELILVMCYVRTDDFWMGENDRSTPYYFLGNIFRSDDRVEELIFKAYEWQKKVIEAYSKNSGSVGRSALELKQEEIKLSKELESLGFEHVRAVYERTF